MFDLFAPKLFVRTLFILSVSIAGIVIGWLLNKQYAVNINLRQNEQDKRKFSAAIEQSPSVVVITDTTGNIKKISPNGFKQSWRFGPVKNGSISLLNRLVTIST